MAKIVQIRRGTTEEHKGFDGQQGEITVDLTENTIRVHDGSVFPENQAAGYPLARGDMSNVINSIGIQQLNLSDGVPNSVLTTDGNGTISFSNTPDVSNSSIGGDLSGTIGNAQINPNTISINELNVVDGTAGQALFTDGAGNLNFNNVVTDPTLGGDLSGTTSNAQINVNAVDGTHIAIGGDTAGDILYYNGIDYTRLAAGTAGQALVMNSGATAPEWGNVGGQEFVEDTFVANGIVDTFAPLSQEAVSEESLLVFIDGVAQPSTAFTLPTTTSITFSSPPPQNSNIRVLHLGTPVPIGNIADNSVTGAKIAMGNDVVGDILYYNGIDYTRLPAGTAGQALVMNSVATAPEWGASAGGPSLGTNHIIRTNAKTITENITFAGTENGMSAGPITIDNGFIVTVTSGSTWTVVGA